MANLAVITVTYFSGEHIVNFVATFRKYHGEEIPIYIANNGEENEFCKTAQAKYVNVHLLEMGDNIGFAAAVNTVYRQLVSDLDYILIANPDIYWFSEVVSELILAAQRQTAGVVGPQILQPDGSIYPSARIIPNLFVGTGHAILGRVFPNNPWSKKYLTSINTQKLIEVDWLSGACLLVNTQAWKQVNGFDETFFMYFEDVDLCYRIKNGGWQIVYVPTVQVKHYQGHSANQHPFIALAAHHDSAYKFLSKRYSSWWQAPLRLGFKIGLQFRKLIVMKTKIR